MSNTEDLAGCMLMFRQDMIDTGVIDASVSPMFMTEGILGAIQRAVLAEREACLQTADQCADADMHASMAANAIRARSATAG